MYIMYIRPKLYKGLYLNLLKIENFWKASELKG